MDIQKYRREEYWARINRALDYIEVNLHRSMTLDKIAEVANFSKFHFHRLFSALIGETLNSFIQRVRIEKAATQLIANPKKTITEVAFDCGFTGSATFARSFKEMFGMSAGRWRNGGYDQFRKNCKVDSNNQQTISKDRKDINSSFYYLNGENEINAVIKQSTLRRKKVKTEKELQVKVNDMPEMPVVYVRHIGPYKGDSVLFEGLFKKLMTWAGPRGLLQQPDMKVLIVYHDSPEVTDESKLRTSICITVSEDTKVDGEIGKMTVPGGKYACAHFEINADEYQQAWDSVCGDWLPDSGYQPDDRPCFELCLNDPNTHTEHKHVIDICIPVKPM